MRPPAHPDWRRLLTRLAIPLVAGAGDAVLFTAARRRAGPLFAARRLPAGERRREVGGEQVGVEQELLAQ